MEPVLLIDFGSTFTKVVAVDIADAALLATAKAPTTVEDINVGLKEALARLEAQWGGPLAFRERWACSSAAGGLRLVTVGVAPGLTAEAARRAALGAGARVLASFSYRLDEEDVRRLEGLQPDLILLAGGTDGGNRDIALHNAARLAEIASAAPVVVACNREVAGEAAAMLRARGKEVRVVDNVMPALGVLSVEPARQAIRDIFLRRIVEAKGLKAAEAYVDRVVMPTPAAVLAAAQLLAEGVPGHRGFGDVVVVDVGGATTDVYSIGEGKPTTPGTIMKGLPEPKAKRTVEGDLGMRISAPSLVEAVGAGRVLDALRRQGAEGAAPWDEGEIRRRAEALAARPGTLAEDEASAAFDTALATVAVGEAVRRHAGYIQPLATPHGLRRLQWGKDLQAVGTVVGTGGVLVHHPRPGVVLRAALAGEDGGGDVRPLLPRDAALMVDKRYLLASAGLLAQRYPEAAFRLLEQHIQRLGEESNRASASAGG